MKTTFTVAGVLFTPVFENKQSGISTQLVNLSTIESIHQFAIRDGEKVAIDKRQIALTFGDFTRMIAVGGWLAQIPLTKLSAEQKTMKKHEMDKIEYSDHVACLNGASVTIERDEVLETLYDETKPLNNEDGTPMLDENQEQVYAPKVDEKGNPMKVLVGYTNTRVVSVQLTPEGVEMAKFKAFNKH